MAGRAAAGQPASLALLQVSWSCYRTIRSRWRAWVRRPANPWKVETDMRRRRIYEGKGKVLYEGPEPGTLVQYFKDDAGSFPNEKQGVITGKGVLNNRISEYLIG